jgi:RNA polymerase sigma-70 factor (ECF subfamily)
MRQSPGTRPSLLVRLSDPADGPAWEEFVEIYAPLIRRLAARQGFQDADAEDLVQDTLQAVARAIPRYDPDPARGSFRGWLFRIARNLMVDFLAGQRRHPRGSGDTGVAELLAGQAAPAGGESALFDEEYRRRLFDWAAGRVRDQVRAPTWDAFWRTAVEGQEAQAVARALGISPGAVYVARNRVMARLRREIERIQEE